MSQPKGEDHFQPSKLGTQEYWDDAYDNELKNFEENGDIGEIWFGSDCLRRVVTFVEKLSYLDPSSSSILDLGTGNGATLFKLAKKGFKKLVGVDYSVPSIELAKKIAEKKELDINFLQDDILDSKLNDKFDLILDKGTFDAISLSEDRESNQRKYIETVLKLLSNDSSFFLITSCNYNGEELNRLFGNDFKFHSEIKYPTFRFGGQEGSTVTSYCWQRK
eukprot:TRINITY_DN2628_c0_g1_i1.p1 TRINITY_DN2628_c0_g1~~TRINITY_DN2628_c0_g1_i1.p1  ORF type:complete len:220 (-),score=88.99 TRINITY_DN2628_c0_g1_i1:65-724(-)